MSLSDDDESLQQAARLMLNYYEFVCEMSGKGILDKNTVDHLRGGLIARTYRACEDFIEAYRREQGRDEAFTMMKEFTQTREKRERASDS